MPEHTGLYMQSLENARHCNEVELWRESHKANMECARAIEDAINKGFRNNHLSHDCARSVIDGYGFDRVNFLLRLTLKHAQQDGRYSEENKAWGRNFAVPSSNDRTEYLINSHPVLLNGFIDEAREEWNKLGLWDSSHCEDMSGADLTNKILVIKPDRLKDEYKTPDDQLFYATSGFGCDPNARGRSVFGRFAKDDENYSWWRTDFIGILKDEFIPDWVKEKYDLKEDNEPSEDCGMEMR